MAIRWEAMRETPCSWEELDALAAIARRPRFSLRTLALELGIDRSAATKRVRALESKEWVAVVRRGGRNGDGPRLTEEGGRVLVQTLEAWQASEDRASKILGASEAGLREGLIRLGGAGDLGVQARRGMRNEAWIVETAVDGEW